MKQARLFKTSLLLANNPTTTLSGASITPAILSSIISHHHNESSFLISSSNTSVQKRNIKQRRFKNVYQNPFDMVDEYKKNQGKVQSLMDAPDYTGVMLYDSLVEFNLKRYEEARNKGVIPGEELLQEEPLHQGWVNFMKATKPKEGEYHPGESIRTGVIGQKVGMVPFWDSYHSYVPLTIIHIPKCQVVQVKTKEKDGYTALQLGAGSMSAKKLTKPLVTEDAILPVGFEITARHFMPGQYIDISGRTKGKGFAGVMKKWGFAGQPASHGVSVVHRSLGSTGTMINKVFKGKKMAGRMGAEQATQLNYYVYMVDVQNNCIYVKGSVPGTNGSYLYLCDARRKPLPASPPFPSFVVPEGEDISTMTKEQLFMEAPGVKPYIWETMGITKEELARAEREELPKVLTSADIASIQTADAYEKELLEMRRSRKKKRESKYEEEDEDEE
ncbi:hypothetical protein C9374_001173 [Naegleria lovaniensis]|uniref:Large ribosomal subunit protein uL3m n=1 Tax=Naegleria lovaniensis TaxID=51637 RepID=A0AA88KN37_NAELO|nr:uncharacterized protein C9374_001173 [Naegleria lovaniensis]KAG2387579.1 hypothetical protein C9374_001173 [Naegleria lovaniensis]